MVEVTNPEEVAKTIGREYITGYHPDELSMRVRDMYRDIVHVNQHKFNQLLTEVNVSFVAEDPYDSYEDMRQSVNETGEFKVFLGGSFPRGSCMDRTETVIGRAVHDWYGHLEAECDFSFLGEFQKWDYVRDDYPEYTHGVLFAEVVAQTAAAYYLPNGFDSLAFEQRAISAPRQWINLTRKCYNANQ